MLCIALSFYANSKYVERRSANEIERSGGCVFYDWEYAEPRGTRESGWIARLVGEQMGGTVVGVHLNAKATDSDLVLLKHFHKLEWLAIDNNDPDYYHGRGFGRTTRGRRRITDAAIVDLIALKRLKRLVLVGTAITDAGLEDLRRALPNCKVVR